MTCIKIGQSGVTYPTATDREWRRGKSKHSGFPTFYILHFRRIGRLFPIRDPVISRRRSGIIDFLGTHWVLPRIFENFAFNIFFHLLSLKKQHLQSLFDKNLWGTFILCQVSNLPIMSPIRSVFCLKFWENI